LYQQTVMDCTAQDKSYWPSKGQWFCARVAVCEQYMSPDRVCVVTKTCAKQSQCYDNGDPYTGKLYDGTIQITSPTGIFPAGTTVTPQCCMNPTMFASDDAVVDFDNICNAAGRTAHWGGGSAVAVWSLVVAVCMCIALMGGWTGM